VARLWPGPDPRRLNSELELEESRLRLGRLAGFESKT
jgi:hypothetical protein